MSKRVLSALILTFAFVACQSQSAAQAKSDATSAAPSKEAVAQAKPVEPTEKPLFATIKTSMGPIVVRLFPNSAPKTVENFVGLATGKKSWRDPKTGLSTNRPLYDGTIFHRVIPQFMIQGGDPMGTGMGGPGYQFEDEFQSGRKFDKPCLLAMANAGPGTNGSQFFITEKMPGHLNGRHTIFGEVIDGCDLVGKIARVPRDGRDRPRENVTIETITISEKKPTK
ncbi:MAG: peptidylprolyl isomerase [Myxococcales bacterium]|jgi:peptidyl-prolyl cis-trans isomerase A (cyclophilin A)|nr:peptidylprolyl isomerase [Myxococcales bacterium]